MVGNLVSFWDGLFSGAMLVSGGVKDNFENVEDAVSARCQHWQPLYFPET